MGAFPKFQTDLCESVTPAQVDFCVILSANRKRERGMRLVLNLVQTLQAATMKGIFFIKVCQPGYSDSSILCQNTNTERVKERESIKKDGSDKKQTRE